MDTKSSPASNWLARELSLLYAVEAAYKLPAAPIVRQLVEWEDQGLPDVVPPVPSWVRFEWPGSGSVNFEAWWRERDRYEKMMGPYL